MAGIRELFTDILPTKEDGQRVLREFIQGKAGLLTYLSFIALLISLIAVARIFIIGHGETTNTNAQVPWGLQITTYIYLVLIGTGCTFANFFGVALAKEYYKPIAPKIIFFALLTAIGGMFGLLTELGHPERMYMWFLSPQPKSPMWWMAVWYIAYLFALIYAFIQLRRGHASFKHLLAEFIIAIITYSTLGALLGVNEARFYYYSALMPIYILILAFMTGAAASAIIAAVEAPKLGPKGEKLVDFFRKMLISSLALALLLGFWRIAIGLYGQAHGAEVFELTLGNQIIYVIILGSIVPLVLLYFLTSRTALILISLYIMVIQFKTRYDLIIGGFKIPVWRAYTVPEIVKYVPTIEEMLVFVGGLSLSLFVYLIANRANMLSVKEEK